MEVTDAVLQSEQDLWEPQLALVRMLQDVLLYYADC